MKKLKEKIFYLFIGSVVLLFFFVLPSIADQTVTFGVRIIYASNNGTGFDPKLEDIRPYLTGGALNYSYYNQFQQDTIKTSVGKTATFALPEGKVLELTPMGIQGGKVRIDFKVRDRGKILEQITLQSTSKGVLFQVLQRGFHLESRVLVIAIQPLF